MQRTVLLWVFIGVTSVPVQNAGLAPEGLPAFTQTFWNLREQFRRLPQGLDCAGQGEPACQASICVLSDPIPFPSHCPSERLKNALA